LQVVEGKREEGRGVVPEPTNIFIRKRGLSGGSGKRAGEK